MLGIVGVLASWLIGNLFGHCNHLNLPGSGRLRDFDVGISSVALYLLRSLSSVQGDAVAGFGV